MFMSRSRRWSTSRRRSDSKGGRLLVYATYTGTRETTARMDDIFTQHSFRMEVIKADTVAPERRKAWVADKVTQGIDAPPKVGADRPRPHRLPNALLIRDRVLCLSISINNSGALGQSIWMRLGLNR